MTHWFFRRALVLAMFSFCCGALGHPDDPKARDFEPAYVGPSVAGLRGGFAEDFNSSGVTLQSWLTVGQLSASATSGADCWGYVSSNGREYAIIGVSDGTAFVDMTNPASMVMVDFEPGVISLWHDVKVFGHYAYAVSEGKQLSGNDGDGIQVFDMSGIDQGTVTLVNTVQDATTDDTHNVAIDEVSGFLYRCGGNSQGLRVYDLSNPSTPSQVGQWSDRYVHDAQIVTYDSGPYAGMQVAFCCSGVGSGGGSDPALDILDVTNKNLMQNISQTRYPSPAFSHQIWLSPDRRFAYLNDELDEDGLLPTTTHVFDITDLENPVVLVAYTNGNGAVGHNLYTSGGLIFEANYRSGLRVFSATDPANPVEIAFFDSYPTDDGASFNGMWSTYPFFPSGNIACSDLNRGLFALQLDVLNFSYPADPPTMLAPSTPQPISVQFAKPGADVNPASVTLHVKIDGGPASPILMTDMGGDLFTADIPGVDCGSTVEYYVSANTASGATYEDPPNGSVQGRIARAFDSVTTIVSHDFESPSGWTSGAVGDNATTGVWGRIVPQYTAAQPGHDRTSGLGAICWATDGRAGGSVGDFDVDNGRTTLLSPVFDLSFNPDAEISYWRWYANTISSSPGDDVFMVDITSDGTTWVNVETIGPTGQIARGGWAQHAFRVADFVNPSATVQMRFIAADLGGGSIVEAAIDDFLITEPICVGVPVCTAPDVNCDGTINGLDLAEVQSPQNWAMDSGNAANARADVNGDGTVNGLDVAEIQAPLNWAASTGPCVCGP